MLRKTAKQGDILKFTSPLTMNYGGWLPTKETYTVEVEILVEKVEDGKVTLVLPDFQIRK